MLRREWYARFWEQHHQRWQHHSGSSSNARPEESSSSASSSSEWWGEHQQQQQQHHHHQQQQQQEQEHRERVSGWWERYHRASGGSGRSHEAGASLPQQHSSLVVAHLAALGLAPTTRLCAKALKEAFVRCAKRFHPDLHQHRDGAAQDAAARFVAARSAYDALRALCA